MPPEVALQEVLLCVGASEVEVVLQDVLPGARVALQPAVTPARRQRVRIAPRDEGAVRPSQARVTLGVVIGAACKRQQGL